MTSTVAVDAAPAHNPFATRWTAPGRIAPLDERGRILDLGGLLGALRAEAGRAAIEGPHGSGKTTLLVALAGRLSRDGRLAGLVRVRSPASFATLVAVAWRAAPGTTVCVDSWEQLGRVGRWAVVLVTKVLGLGLLVTAHRPTGLPVLLRCDVTPDLLHRIVAALPDHGGRIEPRDVEQAFAGHRGNVREALYDLYDRFERRRHDAATASARTTSRPPREEPDRAHCDECGGPPVGF